MQLNNRRLYYKTKHKLSFCINTIDFKMIMAWGEEAEAGWWEHNKKIPTLENWKSMQRIPVTPHGQVASSKWKSRGKTTK